MFGSSRTWPGLSGWVARIVWVTDHARSRALPPWIAQPIPDYATHHEADDHPKDEAAHGHMLWRGGRRVGQVHDATAVQGQATT